MKALIICSGSILDYTYFNRFYEVSDFIICVDGGANHARKMGIIPDVLLGDFDSIDSVTLQFYKDAKVEILQYDVQKDMTDTEIAVELALKKGVQSIVFLGATGSRLDHSLGNILLLKRLLDQGIEGKIINENNEISIINSHIALKRDEGMKVSLVPLSEKVTGITTKGLFYPLKDATIEMGSCLGISNEFADDIAEVSIQSGSMLVIKSKD